jgi:transposase
MKRRLISREQLLRQERLAKPIRDIAWKAQERLCLAARAVPGHIHRRRVNGGMDSSTTLAAYEDAKAAFVTAIAAKDGEIAG